MDDLIEPANLVELLLLDVAAPAFSDEVRARHRALLLSAVTASATTADGTIRDDADTARPVSYRPRRVQRPSRRHLVGAVLAGVALVVAGGGLAVALTKAQPSETTFVRCFALPTTDYGNPAYSLDVGLAVAVSDPSTATTAASALDVCGGTWFRGELSTTAPYIVPIPPGGGSPVPNLVACVLPDGFVGVFPGPEGTCAALGLAVSGA